jgi:vancomycin resistance protein YoaR
LHGAAFFAGLDILERRNHSRPSAYIRPGLDATVSYPVLDLRIQNPFAFPVLVHAKIDGGTLRFEILGHDRPVSVELATETAGIFKYTRKIEKVAGLEGVVVKQRGKNGMAIRRIKTVHLASGESKVVESKDTYPATQEILRIPPDYDVTTLPPLPGDAPAPDAGPTPSG